MGARPGDGVRFGGHSHRGFSRGPGACMVRASHLAYHGLTRQGEGTRYAGPRSRRYGVEDYRGGSRRVRESRWTSNHASQSSTLGSILSTPYNDAYYAGQRDISSTSAGLAAPIVLSMVPVKSVIDVGCGVGTWSARFLESGVTDLVAMDGDYVSRRLLKIPEIHFFAHDLRQPIPIQRRFDLAVCLEVAEHLPSSRAESLVGDLCRLAPVGFF